MDAGDLTEGTQPAGSLGPGLRETLRRTLANLPRDYFSAAETVRALRAVFQAEIASAMEPRFNEHIRAQPRHDYDDKRTLAGWINRELRDLGLSVRCPDSGRPATLLADYRADSGRESRFRIETIDAKGHRRRTFTSADLPYLGLRGAVPRPGASSDAPDDPGGRHGGRSR